MRYFVPRRRCLLFVCYVLLMSLVYAKDTPASMYKSPKISAIQILSRLEKIKRRFYAGAVGYIQSNGDLDFCIAIRCALKQDKVWTLQAGGGIVYDSNADREWEETNEKLGALRSVFEKAGN